MSKLKYKQSFVKTQCKS